MWLEVLAEGSTITRSRAVAEAFSHKPTCVGIEEREGRIEVCHNGREHGLLYVVDEPMAEGDVRPHPRSAFESGGLEWLTNRPLRVRRAADLPIADPPCRADCPRKAR
jgi:hypothetical protein